MSSASTTAAVEEALAWRCATKAFDASKKIGEAEWRALKDCLRLAPSSYGLQPWKFIVVQSPEARLRLREASWGQGQVTDCSHFVVIAALKRMEREHLQKNAELLMRLRGMSGPKAEAYVEGMEKRFSGRELGDWNAKQGYIALGFVMLGAAMLKIDACPMEGIEAGRYDAILGLEGGPWATAVAVALGYRAPEDPQQKQAKARFSEGEVFSVI